jgi:AcrR family transcriptional regulator
MPATARPAKRFTAAERRGQLIDTAMRLFSLHGFTGTTTREIARAAGVNEAIIFRFFPHKDDLYAAILERKSIEWCSDAWVEELRAAGAHGDDALVIRSVVAHLVEHQRRDPVFTRLMLHSALENHSFARQYRERHFAPLHLFLLEYVAARQRDGRFRAGDPHAIVRAVVAVPVQHGLVETLLPDRDVVFGDDVIDVYTNFILAGLRTVPSPAARGVSLGT